jgi:hypothetical protein
VKQRSVRGLSVTAWTTAEAVTISRAARRLQRLEQTVRRLCDRGVIPHIKSDWDARIILARDLDRYAQEQGK